MPDLIAVALGGALGAVLRYSVGLLALYLYPKPLPLGTWAANLLGCLVIGLVIPLLGRTSTPPELRLFLVVGLLGSFTTFSTFSLDTVALWQDGEAVLAVGNAVGSVVLGLAGVWAGLTLGRSLLAVLG